MSESSLWTYVRGKLLPPGIHATRIENGVSAGFPDVHYTYQGKTGTLELKFLRKKKLPFGDDGLNKDQRIWIRDEVDAGGKVWIIADCGDFINIVPGSKAKVFNDFEAEEMTSASSLIVRKRILTKSMIEGFASLL